MKKLIAGIYLLLVFSVSAQADLLFTTGISYKQWDADASGSAAGAEVGENGLNLKQEDNTELVLFLDHPIPMIPNIRLSQTNLSYQGTGTVNYTFLDQTFSANSNSTADLSHTDITFFWGLPIPLPFIDTKIGLSYRVFDGELSATAPDLSLKESVTLDFGVPMLYLGLSVNTPVAIYANVDINFISVSGNSFTDTQYGVGYKLPVPIVDLGVEAGIRSINLETDKDLADVKTSLDFEGSYVGVSLKFGI